MFAQGRVRLYPCFSRSIMKIFLSRERTLSVILIDARSVGGIVSVAMGSNSFEYWRTRVLRNIWNKGRNNTFKLGKSSPPFYNQVLSTDHLLYKTQREKRRSFDVPRSLLKMLTFAYLKAIQLYRRIEQATKCRKQLNTSSRCESTEPKEKKENTFENKWMNFRAFWN